MGRFVGYTCEQSQFADWTAMQRDILAHAGMSPHRIALAFIRNFSRHTMMIKKSIAAAAIALVGASTAGTTFAAEASRQPQGRLDSLMEAIAERFDVSIDEVKVVFEAQQQQVMQQRLEQDEARINAAIEDGTLTQEQADAIREHRKEMRLFMSSLSDLSQEERKAALMEQREADKAWAEENNIPEEFSPLESPRHHGPHGGRTGLHPQWNGEETSL